MSDIDLDAIEEARRLVRPFVDYASSDKPVWSHEGMAVLDDALNEIAALVSGVRRLRDGIRDHSEEWGFVTEDDLVSEAGMDSNERLWSLLPEEDTDG